ncbi:MAG: hypothetical protein ABGY24_10870, partial [bacterium]
MTKSLRMRLAVYAVTRVAHRRALNTTLEARSDASSSLSHSRSHSPVALIKDQNSHENSLQQAKGATNAVFVVLL